MRDDRLTPDERRAFDALPREATPTRGLENRTIAALRESGRLAPGPGRGLVFTPVRTGWAVATVACLIVVSFVAGRQIGLRSAPAGVPGPPRGNGLELAAFVQQAGSTYVAALEELNRTASVKSSPEIEQGREAAVAALYAASDQLVELVPDEPVARTILTTLGETDRIRAETESPQGARVLWF